MQGHIQGLMHARSWTRVGGMTPAEVLTEAASRIREKGWCQFGYHSPRGGMCMMGAVYQVLGEQNEGIFYDEETVGILRSRLAHIPDANLEAWNDRVERTKEDVLALLEGTS